MALTCKVPLLCLLLALASGPAAAHPDLLTQIDALSGSLASSPGNAGLLLKRADLYRRHGDYGAARQDLAAARGAEPGLAALDFVDGRVNLESGRPQDALACFDRYLAARPQEAKAYRLRAEAWLVLGRPAEAAGDFARAIANAPGPSPSLYRQQALALLSAGEQHWPEAQAVIGDALARFPGEASLLGLDADLALAQSRPDQALARAGALPAPLQDLPAWQARTELAHDLAVDDPERREAALRAARASLERQLEAVRPVP